MIHKQTIAMSMTTTNTNTNTNTNAPVAAANDCDCRTAYATSADLRALMMKQVEYRQGGGDRRCGQGGCHVRTPRDPFGDVV
jgi:hypothetical protein